MEATQSAHHVVGIASDKQASDILLLDIREVSSFADYFVIMTANTGRQLAALAEDIAQGVELQGGHVLSREGTTDSGWVLLDCGDVIVHIFGPEERDYYQLEEVWERARSVLRIQ